MRAGKLLNLFILSLWSLGATAQQTQNIAATNATFKTGYVTSTGVAADGNMVVTNTTPSRGWAVFDLSVLPSNALITSVGLHFYKLTVTGTGGGPNCAIYGFAGDLSTVTGVTLYNDCANGTALDNTNWTVASGAAVNIPALSTAANTLVQSNLSSNISLGFVVTSTQRVFTLGGHATTGTNRAILQVTFDTLARPQITGNPAVCTGGTLTLTATSAATNPTFSWTGPGGFTANTATITVPNAAAGTYSVTVSSAGATSFASTIDVTLTALPVSTATSNTPVCTGNNLVFTSTTNATTPVYTWTGPNTFSSSTANPTITAATTAATGTYTLIVTDNATTCSDTVTTAAVVNALPNVTATSNSPVCSGNTLTLTANSTTNGATFSWAGPGGFTGTGGTVSVATTTAANAGIYTVTATANTCMDSAFTTVVVNPTPAITTVTSVNPTTCGGTNGSFTISGLTPNTTYQLRYTRNGTPVGPIAIVSSATGTYTRNGLNAGVYAGITVTLGTCTSAAAGPVTLTNPATPPTPTATNNGPLCVGAALHLTATSTVIGAVYSWTGPTGFTSATQNPNISPVATTNAGTYSVVVTNAQNCTSLPGTTTVVVKTLPTLTVSSNSPVCAGSTLNLTASSTTTGTTFTWTGPVAYTATGGNVTRPNMTPAFAGEYVATALGTNGCSRKDSVNVFVGTVTPATPVATSNSPLCSGNTLTLSATDTSTGILYSWTGPTGFTSALQSPTRPNIAVADSGNYIVTVKKNGCSSNPDTVHVVVRSTVTAAISITANPGDTVCYGTNIVFTANSANGGDDPHYQWIKNGSPIIGAIDTFYGSPYLSNLDTIYCIITSNAICVTSVLDTSNKIGLVMPPFIAPSVMISSSPWTYVPGQNMTFTANVINGGSNPSYQWTLNGSPIAGATSATYSSSTLLPADTLDVIVHSNSLCASPDSAMDSWNAIVSASVTSVNGNNSNIRMYPNPNGGTFTIDGVFKGMNGNKEISVEVLNAMGQVVYKEATNISNGELNKKINMGNDLASGIYILRVNADEYSRMIRFSVTK